MRVPECFIRPDGRGFIVRKGGIAWNVLESLDTKSYAWEAYNGENWDQGGCGGTIMEAVDNALENVRATESTEASVQEGRREA